MSLRVRPSRCVRPIGRRHVASLLATAWLLVAACAGAASSWAGERHEMRAPRMPAARAFAPPGARAIRQERAMNRAAVRDGGRPQNAPPTMPPAPTFAPLPFERPVERPPEGAVGRPGRLTPDERRALRQQINDAGRDIYRAPHP